MTKRLFPPMLTFGLASVLGLVSVGGCNAKVATVLEGRPDGGAGDSDQVVDGSAGVSDEDRPLVPASKVDILLVVDNSTSMADKSSLLASSLGTLIRNVATGRDVHLGVITSSLGNSGGDVCDESRADNNGHAHLRTTGEDGSTVTGAETGVLTYSGGDVDTFVNRAEALVRGVGQNGCGIEAQLESMYRFLIQPDPWEKIAVANNKAVLGDGVDLTVIGQRKAFLRPDSALVVLMLTDEDDASLDPRSINGQGWAFASRNFPGSKIQRAGGVSGTTAPHGTAACASDPGSAACTSCAFAESDPACQTNGGYFGPDDDDLNVRFQNMKRRYGVDPQFPLQRYIDGLTKSKVPDRDAEHVQSDGTLAPYTHTPKCTNPVFAAELPSESASSVEELCNLARGPRSRELVLFALLGGVPKELATASPDWVKIVGQDPAHYDTTGIDPHMIESTEPRPGLADPNGAATDPIHGREYNTNKMDLQYACTFALPSARTCSDNDASCDCAPSSQMNPPLCGTPGQQLRAKAYPTIRPLRVAQGLGERGIVGSVCATDYAGVLDVLNQRLAPRLTP